MKPPRVPLYGFPDVVLHVPIPDAKGHQEYAAAKTGDIRPGLTLLHTGRVRASSSASSGTSRSCTSDNRVEHLAHVSAHMPWVWTVLKSAEHVISLFAIERLGLPVKGIEERATTPSAMCFGFCGSQ